MKRILLVLIACSSLAFGNAAATASNLTTVTTIVKLIPPPHVPIPKSERWFLPIFKEGPAAIAGFECIINRESTSTVAHPNLRDDNGNPGQSGIFQMNNQPGGIWDHYVLPHLHVLLWKATAYQQAWGAALIWRIKRFYPWTRYDGCS